MRLGVASSMRLSWALPPRAQMAGGAEVPLPGQLEASQNSSAGLGVNFCQGQVICPTGLAADAALYPGLATKRREKRTWSAQEGSPATGSSGAPGCSLAISQAEQRALLPSLHSGVEVPAAASPAPATPQPSMLGKRTQDHPQGLQRHLREAGSLPDSPPTLPPDPHRPRGRPESGAPSHPLHPGGAGGGTFSLLSMTCTPSRLMATETGLRPPRCKKPWAGLSTSPWKKAHLGSRLGSASGRHQKC